VVLSFKLMVPLAEGSLSPSMSSSYSETRRQPVPTDEAEFMGITSEPDACTKG
jgi:hypothetical protein